MNKPWTKRGREKYAAHPSKGVLAAACGISRQSLTGYARSEKGQRKAVQTPLNVARILASLLDIGVENFGQKRWTAHDAAQSELAATWAREAILPAIPPSLSGEHRDRAQQVRNDVANLLTAFAAEMDAEGGAK